ncbi:trypsin-5-like [Contarinia nasturtii]|uniref:trypsin-5-like n=1 Tax=Contarinia nasturtii TaxID=265458 RepID=UPI0012D48835|nr:trypsin-5-like [Contarinia nasturtii]
MNLFCVLLIVFVLTEYSKTVVSQIIDGIAVENIKDYNYIVGIQYHRSDGADFYNCIGTIINSYKIVTAAHCLFNNTPSFTLIFGSQKLTEPVYTVNITDLDYTIHPKYSRGSPYLNDIGVIELKKALPFGEHIGKIDMVDKKMIEKEYAGHTDEEVTMLGYTTSEHPKRTPSYSPLMSVVSKIADFAECKRTYRKRKQNCVLDFERQFCVALRGPHHNMHLSNAGDSGGPVILKLWTKSSKPSIKHFFLGFTSNDIRGLPEICTKVAGHLDFIANPKAFVAKYNKKQNAASKSKSKFKFSKCIPSM